MTKAAGIEHFFDVVDLQDDKASDLDHRIHLDLTAEERKVPLNPSHISLSRNIETRTLKVF